MSPLHLVLAAAPTAPGASTLLARAEAEAEAGRGLRILLSGAGLAWAGTEALARLARRADVRIVLCSQSARQVGRAPDAWPAFVGWSSLVRWLVDVEPGAALWGAFP